MEHLQVDVEDDAVERPVVLAPNLAHRKSICQGSRTGRSNRGRPEPGEGCGQAGSRRMADGWARGRTAKSIRPARHRARAPRALGPRRRVCPWRWRGTRC